MRCLFLLLLTLTQAFAGTVLDNTLLNISIGSNLVEKIESKSDTGENLEIKPGFVYKVGYGVRYASGFGMMFNLGYDYNTVDKNTQLLIQHGYIHHHSAGIEGMFHTAAKYNINPYFGLGIGIMNSTSSITTTSNINKTISDTRPFTSLTTGIEYRVDRFVGIDTQLKYKHSQIEFADKLRNNRDDVSNISLTIGLQYSL